MHLTSEEISLPTCSGCYLRGNSQIRWPWKSASLRGKVLVIWDGLPVHRSRQVQQFVAEQGGRLQVERLPAYAPELNPVEYLWGYWKQHELPNFCPKTFGELSHHARQALRRMRRHPTLVTAFWKQAKLFG